MYRSLLVVVGAFALALLCWVPIGRTDSPDQNPPAEAKLENRATASTAADLVRKLSTQVTLVDRLDGPLSDVIQHLEAKCGVVILVDHEAFEAELQEKDVTSRHINWPKLQKMRFSTVLEKLTGQFQGSYLIKPDHIAIMPRSRVETAVWGNNVAADGVCCETRPRARMPIVHAVFDNRPLNEALKELTDASGVSVLLDSRRAGDQAKAEVTATLLNAPLDTAVRILANQAELDAVLIDNVLYVTTSDNALTLRPARRQMMEVGLGGVGVAR